MTASFMATNDIIGLLISVRFIHCIYPVSSRSLALFSRASSQDHQNSNSEPRRITSNVKQSLQYLKLLKELRKEKQGTNRPSTSYRKKKVDKEESLDDLEYYEDPTTRLYYTKGDFEFARPVLLVDGYNMCGYWAKLKKHFVKGNLEYARRKLLEELITFSVIKGVKVVVVFDAALSGMCDHKENFQGIDVVYSATSSADSWIEREAGDVVDERWLSKGLGGNF